MDSQHPIFLKLGEDGEGWYLQTNLYEYLPRFETQMVSTELLGEAFEPEQKFESPDGTPIVFNLDYFGARREPVMPLAGPFANGGGRIKL